MTAPEHRLITGARPLACLQLILKLRKNFIFINVYLISRKSCLNTKNTYEVVCGCSLSNNIHNIFVGVCYYGTPTTLVDVI